jgi:general secretion pathway protein L
MTGLGDITAYLSRWIDSVAAAITGMLSVRARRSVQVTEQDGAFVLQVAGRNAASERVQIADGQLVAPRPDAIETALRGSHAELALQPSRFMFRPLELPQRASEFLDGVVRAQIDRLTPWSANEAAFGWSAPAEAGPDRMVVTVAATARALIQPLIDTLIAAGAESVSVTALPAPARPPRSGCSSTSRAARSMPRACGACWSRCSSAPDCSPACR